MNLIELKGANKIERAIKNVGSYVRKSRGDEEVDLEKHKFAIEEKCKEEGWESIPYEEIGSGETIEGRPKMKELLNDVGDGMFDAVVVFDFDRIGRGGSGDQEKILLTFKHTDTLLITINPSKVYDFNDESDEQVADFQGFMAKLEYKTIKRRLWAGKRLGLKKGNFVHGIASYGYKYNPEIKGLEIVNDEKEIIRDMVDMYLNKDISFHQIAIELNRRDIPSPKNATWYSSTVTRMLKSKIYIGSIVANKTTGVWDKTGKNKTAKPFKKNEESEWQVVDDCHEPIITKVEHEQINKKMGLRRKGKTKETRTFSGLIRCADCGKRLPMKSATRIANCSGCGNGGGELDVVEYAIKQTTLTIKNKLKNIKVADLTKTKEKQLQAEISKLKDDLKKEHRAIERIEYAYEEEEYGLDKYRSKMKKRNNNISEIKSQIDNITKELESYNEDKYNKKIDAIDIFIREIDKSKSEQEMNALYKRMIRDIYWKKQDKIEVTICFY